MSDDSNLKRKQQFFKLFKVGLKQSHFFYTQNKKITKNQITTENDYELLFLHNKEIVMMKESKMFLYVQLGSFWYTKCT